MAFHHFHNFSPKSVPDKAVYEEAYQVHDHQGDLVDGHDDVMVDERHVMQQLVNNSRCLVADGENDNPNQDLGGLCVPAGGEQDTAKNFRGHIDVPDHRQVEEEDQSHGDEELDENYV